MALLNAFTIETPEVVGVASDRRGETTLNAADFGKRALFDGNVTIPLALVADLNRTQTVVNVTDTALTLTAASGVTITGQTTVPPYGVVDLVVLSTTGSATTWVASEGDAAKADRGEVGVRTYASYTQAELLNLAVGTPVLAADNEIYKLAADAKAEKLADAADATARVNTPATHGQWLLQTDTSQNYYYSTITEPAAWVTWNGTDPIPANAKIAPAAGVKSWQNSATNNKNKLYANVSDLRADTITSSQLREYSGAHVLIGNHAYSIAADSAVDHHLQNAGGAKFYVIPDQSGHYHAAAIGSGDIGADCNILLQNVAGDKTCVYIEAGTHALNTSIIMDETVAGSNAKIQGAGRLQTTLIVADNIIGINAFASDEACIEGFQLSNGGGGRSSIGVLVGGTTCNVSDVWCGALSYGLVYTGAGSTTNNVVVELCTHGIVIGAGFYDSEYLTAPINGGVSNHTMTNVTVSVCGNTNLADAYGGVIIDSFDKHVLSALTGPIPRGTRVTGDTSGARGYVFGTDNASNASLYRVSGVFQAGETLTMDNGQTATLISTNRNSTFGIEINNVNVRNCDRVGMYIYNVNGLVLDGTFYDNGELAVSDALGLLIQGPRAVGVSINANFYDNGVADDTQLTNGAGLEVNALESVIKLTNSTFGNKTKLTDPNKNRTQEGIRVKSGKVLISNPEISKCEKSILQTGGEIAVVGGYCETEPDVQAGTFKSTGCLGIDDQSYTTTPALLLNSATGTIVTSQPIAIGMLHRWEFTVQSANEALSAKTAVDVWRRKSNGNINAQIDEQYGAGNGTFALVSNGDGTYNITVENVSANDKIYSGMLLYARRQL